MEMVYWVGQKLLNSNTNKESDLKYLQKNQGKLFFVTKVIILNIPLKLYK